MKRRLLLLVASILLSALLLEACCTALAWSQFNELSVARLNDLDVGNEYVAAIPDGYASTLQAHPYVGWQYNAGFERRNNVGTIGRDFSLTKDSSWFTVLLTGGSVAEHLAASGHLERALERIDGKPVRVLCGGIGGGHEPQQTIMLMLYGDVCDAVVDLSGFNERNRFNACKLRLEYCGSQFAQLNPLASGGFDRLAKSWECNRLRRFSRDHNSRALFFVTRIIRQRIEASAAAPDVADETWRLPAEWTAEQRNEFNLQQYRKYLSLSDAMAERLGIRAAHFIQPCPAIGKVLTEDERRVVGDLSYATTYRKLASDLPAISLLDCFDDVRETVYTDAVHNNDVGKRIMAERIARELAKSWAM